MQDLSAFNAGLLSFLDSSPSPWHAVQSLSARLEAQQFIHLQEDQPWQLEAGQGYYITRNDSSLIAWRQPTDAHALEGLRMVGAHTDSPCLRVKPQPELHRKGYFQLSIDVYGGALLNPWFDRDLSLAGRITWLSQAGEVKSSLIDFERAIAVVPSLAIHLDREANNSRNINAQTYLPVVLSQTDKKPDFRELLRQQLLSQQGIDASQVLDYELCFYDTQKAALLGLDNDFLMSARLDNLLSCYIGLQALLDAEAGAGQMLICNDHEEVGSQSACGAHGPMLRQVLERIWPESEVRNRIISRSLMVSADNAHAVHPNFSDKHDENHGPALNAGPVIKVNANQRYATNSETSALFRKWAQDVNEPVQMFAVRSDMGCGSTIGPITAGEIGVRTVDIGVPQFAMHSIREMAGSRDALGLAKILQHFYTVAQID